MIRLLSTLAASGAGKVSGLDGSDLSTTVMEQLAKASRRVKARAVLRPNTPEPMMRIEEGGEKGAEEESAVILSLGAEGRENEGEVRGWV